MARLKELMDSTTQITSNTMCDRLHKLFCSMPRYTWNQITQIPFANGIYIIFEKGEQYHGMERVVRVGTHKSSDRLRTRLSENFVEEKHDSSIFRKNVGKAILNADRDPYLKIWTIKNCDYMDKEKNADTERRVSKYLQEKCSFTVFEVTDMNERLRMEEAIIATLNAEPEFVPSSKWFGLYSPEQKIRKSGMWLIQGLNGNPITETEFERVLELCGKRLPATKGKTAQPDISAEISRQSCGKYVPLFQFLKRQTAQQIIITYGEAEAILGFKLPNSAYNYPMWWKPNGHPHCQAWLQAGFDVENVGESIRTKIITFERIE